MKMINRKDKMLHLVLSDEKLRSEYEIDPNDFPTIHDALRSENPIVLSVAMIIESITDSFDEADMKSLYKRIQQHLNGTLLI